MFFRIVAFVLPLGLDTLAIAIALGLRGFRPWRPALLFATFEGVMPVLGIALARVVSLRFETGAIIFGGLVLIGLGIHAIREALEGEAEEVARLSFGSWRSSLLAGLAISMDELSIGFPLGVSKLPIRMTLVAITGQAFFITALGVSLGSRMRSGLAETVAHHAGVAAGVVFALLGLWLIIERALL